jgi:hypothetical protein
LQPSGHRKHFSLINIAKVLSWSLAACSFRSRTCLESLSDESLPRIASIIASQSPNSSDSRAQKPRLYYRFGSQRPRMETPGRETYARCQSAAQCVNFIRILINAPAGSACSCSKNKSEQQDLSCSKWSSEQPIGPSQ